MARHVVVLFIVFVSMCFISGCAAPYTSKNADDKEVGEFTSNHSKNSRTFPVTVSGKGVSPNTGYIERDMLMSDRAAVIDAYRNLSERIAGLVVESYSRQGNFITDRDLIQSETASYIRGARVMDVTNEGGISTAIVKILLPVEKFRWYFEEHYPLYNPEIGQYTEMQDELMGASNL
jgi:hypothetical protein